MKQFLFFSLLSLALMSCYSSQPTQAVETVEVVDVKKPEDYKVITDHSKWADYVGEKVQLKAMLCNFEMQHMIRADLEGETSYICIDILSKKNDNIRQILAYTTDKGNARSYKGKVITTYGVLRTVSGAGKGGGTHTEYYLDLDFIQ